MMKGNTSPVGWARGARLLLLAFLFLLLACAPGGSSLPRSWFCTTPALYNRLCFFVEGTPRVGVPFTLAIDAFYRNWENEPPITLTIIAPSTLEILSVEAPHPYQIETDRPVGLVDPWEGYGDRYEGVFTVPGTRITMDMGHEPVGRLWSVQSKRELPGDRVRLTLRVREAGEWQIHARLEVPYIRPGLKYGPPIGSDWIWLGLLGWSTEAEAYWTDYETAMMRMLKREGEVCSGLGSCTLRFPYDPYRYALGLRGEIPGRSLRERPTVFCNTYNLPGTCSEHGKWEVSPEEAEEYYRQLEEEWNRRLTPSPPPGVERPQGAPVDLLEIRGRVMFQDPQTGELWHRAERPCRAGRERSERGSAALPPPPLRCRDVRLMVTHTAKEGDQAGAYWLALFAPFPIHPMLRIVATDDQRVIVRRPLNERRTVYFYETDVIAEDVISGVYVRDVVLSEG